MAEMRWRYGETNPVMIPVASEAELEIGDLVVLTSGEAEPADEEATAAAMAAKFAGVSAQRHPGGHTGTAEVRVDTRGVFEFPLNTATTLVVGDLIKVHVNGGAAVKDVVAKATDPEEAIGYAVRAETNATKALFRIVPRALPAFIEIPAGS